MKKTMALVLLCGMLLLSSGLFSVNGTCTNPERKQALGSQRTHVSFAAFTDTHIGSRYQNPLYTTADHLDALADDLTTAITPLDFAVHLGDIVNHNTAQVNGQGLPGLVDQYRNDVKAFLISHVDLPFFCVIGNHDVDDYQMNSGDPHNLTKSLIDELSMNNPVYAMMYDGILFLVVPELGDITWTHPVEYQWLTTMTHLYRNTTTVILCHQAIEDTTKADTTEPYRGKQDMDWWANLFQENPQILMWIHGHNHYLDWYLGNQSTGETYPVRYFGHDMVFSAPYPQMNWQDQYDVDRIVIYNISARNITTAAWEIDGDGGRWIPEYTHFWNISTTYDPDIPDWYAFPVFLQDNETQLTDQKVLSPDVTLQLIGTAPMELFYDPYMQSPSSRETVNEVILGFGHDRTGRVEWTDPGMRVRGPTFVTFPDKLPHQGTQEDGRSGQPYQTFPMGTIAAAVPGQTYEFLMTARCPSGDGTCKLTVSCSSWGMRFQYSTLPSSTAQVFTHTFGPANETVHGTYTVPENANAWFLQGMLTFLDSTEYEVSMFSVKRAQTSNTTDAFHLLFNGQWYNASGPLVENDRVNFSLDPRDLSDANGTMDFTAYIQGNRYGMVNLMYHEPILMGMNARFRVDDYSNGVFDISLIKTISRESALSARVWDSSLFQRFPHGTEILYRLLIDQTAGRLLQYLFNKMTPVTFRMYPFSRDALYAAVTITADDGSGVTHTSPNGNIWLTCNGPLSGERHVTIALSSR